MARRPKVRVTYKDDSAYLIRLQQAVEMDPMRSSKWKRQVSEHINALTLLFVQDDGRAIANGKKT